MPAPDYRVQSLARAVSVLSAFSTERPELTIGEIAQHGQLPRSTVHRLVVNLLQLGFLTRDPRTDRYRLSLFLLELGTIALSGIDVREKALPIMEALATSTGEAVFLAVLEHDWAVYIQKAEGQRVLRMTATIGRRAPLHCTATGKTLLAYLTEAQVRRIAAETGLPARTHRSITAVESLLAHLATIRLQGYAIDDGESEEGLAGIAAPVRGHAGEVIAALVVAGPRERILPDGRPDLAPVVVAAAEEIALLQGYRPVPLPTTGERSQA